jgi:hypothetical protein
MDTIPAGVNDAVNLFYSNLARVILFKSAARDKSTIEYREYDSVEYWLILLIKRAIYEDVIVIARPAQRFRLLMYFPS